MIFPHLTISMSPVGPGAALGWRTPLDEVMVLAYDIQLDRKLLNPKSS